ncbi:MAG: Uma2 family endonuclease [Labilithrix sp.]|nr:Uma2 family endonuclease [Labilithrix sp.]
MVQRQQDDWPPRPDVSHLITSDDAPVDSFLQGAQMKLLTAQLDTWKAPGGRPFIAAANVGVFAVPKNPAVVPDVFLSLDVEQPPFAGPDRQDSYFVWEHGKPPDLVIEIVSKTKGGELAAKLRQYERMRVTHYVVFDPLRVLSDQELSVFTLQGGAYVLQPDARFPDLGLALTRWEGDYSSKHFDWLRWTHLDGTLLPIVAEEKARADGEKARADALAERLRALGVDPEG